ncbi:hypothetical protein BC830DRAFT_1083766 [Chytriomyces sp. MP71]|nr:hypothetical protein BC830DRAFT_1083766 [Chytriomyces sp. MP71]
MREGIKKATSLQNVAYQLPASHSNVSVHPDDNLAKPSFIRSAQFISVFTITCIILSLGFQFAVFKPVFDSYQSRFKPNAVFYAIHAVCAVILCFSALAQTGLGVFLYLRNSSHRTAAYRRAKNVHRVNAYLIFIPLSVFTIVSGSVAWTVSYFSKGNTIVSISIALPFMLISMIATTVLSIHEIRRGNVMRHVFWATFPIVSAVGTSVGVRVLGAALNGWSLVTPLDSSKLKYMANSVLISNAVAVGLFIVFSVAWTWWFRISDENGGPATTLKTGYVSLDQV